MLKQEVNSQYSLNTHSSQNQLQTNRDILVHIPLCVSPSKSKETLKFAKGEALRLLRTNSSNKNLFKTHLAEMCFEQRGNPKNLIYNTPSEEKNGPSSNREIQTIESCRLTQYYVTIPKPKEIMSNTHLTQPQPLLCEVLKEPVISYRNGRLFQEILVTAKL